MEVAKSNISSLLEGAKQYVIPIYQRTYSWEKSQCIRLWDDIMYIVEMDTSAHFIGSIVNIEDDRTAKGFQRFMIIDGQQRVTTVLLLMIAIRDHLRKLGNTSDISHNEVNDRYIVNAYETGLQRFKLLLTQADKELLTGLIDGRVDVFEQKSRIIENYHFFLQKITGMKLNVEQLLSGIDRLQLVNISLDRTSDDPQAIFESLNSTGVELSQSDLIRNNVLMKLDIVQQEQVYNQYWLAFEQLFLYDKKFVDMDRFFRDYLVCKTGIIPPMTGIYDAFKKYMDTQSLEIWELANELYTYGKLYTRLLYATADDFEIKEHFHDIMMLRVEVVYPAILQFYVDYEAEHITHAEFLYLLAIMESYVFRRSITGAPTNTLNRFIIGLLAAIQKSKYVASIQKYLKRLDEKSAFPTDTSFAEAFKERAIYQMRNRKYIMYKLESFDNKTPIDMERYTIEHIMPQSKRLNAEWKKALGDNYTEIQKKYVHTIGNLTLTAYNFELSNNAFVEKKKMKGGFQETNLRLNKDLLHLTTWGEEQIVARANKLADLACKVWQYYAEEKVQKQESPKETKEQKNVKVTKQVKNQKNPKELKSIKKPKQTKEQQIIEKPEKLKESKNTKVLKLNNKQKVKEKVEDDRIITVDKFTIHAAVDGMITIYNNGQKVSAYPILLKLANEHNIPVVNASGEKYSTKELGAKVCDFFESNTKQEATKTSGLRVIKQKEFMITEYDVQTYIVTKHDKKVSAYPILQKLAVEYALPIIGAEGKPLPVSELGQIVFMFFEQNKMLYNA